MKAVIFSIGTEHLAGKITDTNAPLICRNLKNLGIEIIKRCTLADNRETISRKIKSLLTETDIIITIAGLGPTHDDLTREAVSDALQKKLVYKPEIWEKIKQRFKTFHKEPTPNNKKQAYILEKGSWFNNKLGTAPGLSAIDEKTKTIVYLLPGPPRELEYLLNNYLLPDLKKKMNMHNSFYHEIFRVYGVGEGEISWLLKDLTEKNSEIDFGIYSKSEGYIELDFTFKNRLSNNVQAEAEWFEFIKNIKNFLQQNQFTYTGNNEIAELTGSLLLEKKLMLGVAESITGGNIMSSLVQIPGCSQYLCGGAVTYSNELKISLLNVKTETLRNHGAVSPECARQMTDGLLSKLNCDIGLSVTGIAGPTGGSQQKPIGLVYISTGNQDHIETSKHIFSGHRKRIISKATNQALLCLYKFLLKK